MSYDPGRTRKARRSGREKGVHVYLPADELTKAGYDVDQPLTYRVWGTPRGIMLRLYKPDAPLDKPVKVTDTPS